VQNQANASSAVVARRLPSLLTLISTQSQRLRSALTMDAGIRRHRGSVGRTLWKISTMVSEGQAGNFDALRVGSADEAEG